MNNIGPDSFGRGVIKIINNDGTVTYTVYSDMTCSQVIFSNIRDSEDDVAAMYTINSLAPG